ncbi:HAD-IA family hydrolase [Phenylobacterium sp. RIFCSPHIGHO2_01_FULL_69_31]|uniref:HAD-IIA family hydrolase n=1 Tax=Phenylobacterium sp. RIFCSPHIGHO2_01_FULL_69_31 TaxID=1801944 RepID=UPI000B2B4B0B|nr:HAD-IA family hydrolase [Phenylobacterium sp. RIFCSPHIGHO2_01_FULL_69_31]
MNRHDIRATPWAAAIEDAVEARQVIADAKALLFDWDGCAAIADRPQAAAVALMAARPERFAIVSNNTSHGRGFFSDRLRANGIHAPPERVILAGIETLLRARQLAPERTLLLAAPRMEEAARRMGLDLVTDEPELVVLLRDTRFSYAKLTQAVNAVRRGAGLLVGNPDRRHPSAEGRVMPETGSLLAAILAGVGPGAEPFEVVGKPHPTLFLRACEALGVQPEDAVMIGDNPETDVAGAAPLGLRCILVDGPGGLTLEDLAR